MAGIPAGMANNDAMLSEPWYIRLFGGLTAQSGERFVARFATYKTGALLAYLAFFPRSHSRELLVDLFWPEVEENLGRKSLTVALVSLRHALEPPGVESGSVLAATRATVGLSPSAFRTDVQEFQTLVESATGDMEQANLLRAVSLYKAELLPGYYEDWLGTEREHLAVACGGALRRLTRLLASVDPEKAVGCALRAIQIDPLDEEAREDLIRLYASLNRPADAVRHYREWEKIAREELGMLPSEALQDFIAPLASHSPSSASSQLSRPHRRREAPANIPAAAEEEARLPGASSPARNEARLPPSLSSFFGRIADIEQIGILLEEPSNRLITLTGPGGIGKTRLSLEVARRFAAHLERRVGFVALAEITEEGWIAGRLLEALEIAHAANQDPMAIVIAELRRQPTLLVMDNFEQLASSGTGLIRRLLEGAPELQLLVTSRVALSLEGEQMLVISTLPTPTYPGTPERLLEFASVQLFVDRAQKVHAGFQLTPRNAGEVAALCHRLEGIPLAIELAAGWARTLTAGQILERISRRFDLLISRRRDVEERHGSLRAVMEQSFRLLSANVRSLFCRLSVFQGGWEAEAAEAICEEPQALSLLAELQDHSLLLAEEKEGRMRFRFLDTVREFAGDQLRSKQEAGFVQRLHADYFLALAVQADASIDGPDRAIWLRTMETEYPNLCVALDFWLSSKAPSETSQATEKGNTEGQNALRLAGALWNYWDYRGLVVEGQRWLQQALAKPDAQAPTNARASALSSAGILAWRQGDLAAAYAFHSECLTIRRNLEDQRGVGASMSNFASIAHLQGDFERARVLFQDALACFESLGNRLMVAHIRHNLGGLLSDLGEAAAEGHHREALATYRELGWTFGIGSCLSALGTCAAEREDYAAALNFYEEALALSRLDGNRLTLAMLLYRRANIAARQEEHQAAWSGYSESLQILSEIQNNPALLVVLRAVVYLLMSSGLLERAVRLYSALESLRTQMGVVLRTGMAVELDARLEQCRHRLGASAFNQAWEAGAAMTMDETVAFALALTPVPLPEQSII